MEKIIYTDIDLTLLEFNIGFENFLRDERGMDLPQGKLIGYAQLPHAIEISHEEADKLVHDFFDHHGFANLPALDHAPEATQRLYNEGWRFVGISACPESVGTERRKKNLEEVLGIPFEAVHLSGYAGCKKAILESVSPSIWVEDNVNHAHVGHELGFKTYLIEQGHNRDAEVKVTRVSSWKEIADDLCTER